MATNQVQAPALADELADRPLRATVPGLMVVRDVRAKQMLGMPRLTHSEAA